jgi:hypothetical protein
MTFRLLVSVALLLSVAHVSAQQTEVSGSVHDIDGRVLPGVRVEVMGENDSRRQVVTNSQGRFRVAGLNAGVYSILFILPGFEPDTLTDITVRSGSTVNVGEITLRVAALAETVQRPVPLLPPRDMRPECLHGRDETDSERQRRVDAFLAMHLIASLLERVPVSIFGYPDWQTLARSKAVNDLQTGAGPSAELAQKIQWGDPEPLPGWDLAYARSQLWVRFALTDSRDPCGFSYDSDDLPRNGRVLPLR